MDEVDPNIVLDISAASKPGAAVETNQLAGPSSNTILYSELDISTNDQQSRILEDDIFKSLLFLEFQEEMNAIVVK
ncbi:hypothetical protein BCR41DRAFT_400082 [Lobosporangium transversale]|uniref:Uncharacterized protein n=1 Tax=Lobosporangium transversale TaxID=64571 RepID=A0A1Y2GG12_9FUNG|nr:hypothetical protein BCR41DRAFT_400082 [Lobosporangium transversale]ORZ06568.1 hypothetical protein BCR41DRAFT_400082 [Lobosporangium transversale]|eukprot:XP_021877611.1 hypothetical protein BCR41DRAFT_400082 [Lobosporangium transversale]